MNYKMIGRIISRIVGVEALFMLPALLISVVDSERDAVFGFLLAYAVMIPFCVILYLLTKKASSAFYAREGLLCVGLSWFIISLLGCLPFVFSGEIKGFVNALFEIVSGFTTTGASVLSDVESLSRGMLYWRSFSHWLGGMGVLVFILAVIPVSGRSEGFTLHLMRAESPGPVVSKLVPKIRNSALILYLIYVAFTVLDVVFLLFGKMPLFEAICTAFGTAGTGGFGIKNDSMASYSPYIQNVTTVFMFLFGINFSCYYMVLMRQFKSVLKNEELRMYFIVYFSAVAAIALNVYKMYGSLSETLRHAAFQVSSIITTTGYSTTDFNIWPGFSKTVILFLMIIGACAGSTGGGLKCGRAMLLFRGLKRNIKKNIFPRKVEVVTVDGQAVNEQVLDNTNAYLAAYVVIIIISLLVVSLDGFSVETNVSAVISCFNNIGPGLDRVGPMSNFSCYGILSKLVLIFDMLAGRLEIFPVLAIFAKSSWTRKKL